MVCLYAREVELELSQESSATPQETTQETAIETTQEDLTPMEAQIIALIRFDAAISRKSMAERLGLMSDGVKYHLTVLKNRHVLHHEGPTKKGHWVIDSVKKGGVR